MCGKPSVLFMCTILSKDFLLIPCHPQCNSAFVLHIHDRKVHRAKLDMRKTNMIAIKKPRCKGDFLTWRDLYAPQEGGEKELLHESVSLIHQTKTSKLYASWMLLFLLKLLS